MTRDCVLAGILKAVNASFCSFNVIERGTDGLSDVLSVSMRSL